MLLDDPSPLVRRALAEALAGSARCAAAVIHALVNDQPDIAALVLERSPLLVDSDLVDTVAGGGRGSAGGDRAPRRPAALGRGRDRRSRQRRSLPDPDREPVRRHRAVLARPHRRAFRPSRGDPRSAARAADLPAATRQALVVKLSETLAGFVVARNWLDESARAAHRAGGVREERPWRSPASRDVPRGLAADRAICARAASSLPGWCCARCSPATSLLFEQALGRACRPAGRARQRAGA